jgi:Kef-type K+ transport system membrane component KefB
MPASPVHIESLLLQIIIQLIVIVGCARAAGALFRRLGQPQVCGEIAAGVILGPSVFGALLPHAQRMLFDPAAGAHISILSQIGLVFMMFLIGLEFDFAHLAGSSRTALSISSAGIILPFALGIMVGGWIHSQMNLQVEARTFSLFIATALSITAMPVLGRIMIEFNMTRTRLGALTITAAAMDDAVGWLLLALVSAIAGSQFHSGRLFLAAAEVVAYLMLMIFIARPLLVKWVRWAMRDSGGELSLNALAQLMIFFLASAAITNMIGIFSVFGAFVMGGILYDQAEFRAAVNRRMRDFVTVFFLPIFFTYTGLRTEVGSLRGGDLWLICAIVVLVASIGKFGGCSLAARLNGLTWREASSVGITRGLMELIVLNTGYDLGIIPKPVFFIMVMMAVVTTYATAPVLSRLIHGTEMQPYFEISPFMQRRAEEVKSLASRRTA